MSAETNAILEEGKQALREMYAEEEQARHDERMAPHRAEQERQAAAWRRQQDAAERQQQISQLEQRAAQGDQQAAYAVQNVRAQEAHAVRGRQAVLEELGADISGAVAKLDIPDDTKARLMMAPTMTQFAQELRKAPQAAQRAVRKSMQDYSAQAASELDYWGPSW